MKNILLIALAGLLSIQLSATTDSLKLNKDPIPDTSQITLTKVYNDVKSGLNGLEEALKVGSEHVYGVLIKQQLVTAISYLILVILLLIACPFSVKLEKKWRAEHDDFGDGPACLVPIIVNITTVIVIFITITDIITGFINPEYGALKDIMNFIK
jgi:hypothetical protein